MTQGSITKTAKALSVHPTTVTRRIAELEKFVGARLLKRINNSYKPTVHGDKALEIARKMAEQVRNFQRLQEQISDEICGTIRITAIESFVINCLLPHMPDLRKKYPQLNLEFISSDFNLSFTHRETDLAIRFSKPALINTVSRKLGEVGFALYANRDRQQDWSEISSEEIDWVGYDDEFQNLPEARWLADAMKKPVPVIKSTNAGVLKTAIRVGLGVGVLPCYRGDFDNGLRRISGSRPVVRREAWLLMHDDYRSNSTTGCVIDWITNIFETDQKQIAG